MDVVVLSGSWSDSSAASVSPTAGRISFPGVRPLKAQLLAITPAPRSSMADTAVRVTFCTLPVLLRFLSVATTTLLSGLTSEEVLLELPEPLPHAASAPSGYAIGRRGRPRVVVRVPPCPPPRTGGAAWQGPSRRRPSPTFDSRCDQGQEPAVTPHAPAIPEPSDAVAPHPQIPPGRLISREPTTPDGTGRRTP
ncbi:hypothetical protein [Streptomyces fuscichromogenes]|uniref:hypothetical protein n=1 Tax=Streptomyces fuscichromogenes TaxID=1324013 RepID=UPI0027E56C48|nr:hypothetical protein [Streptomyces fuscichromogenes]